MTELKHWTAARSGASLTVSGTDALSGAAIKVAGVTKIQPSLQRPGVCIAYTKAGDHAFLQTKATVPMASPDTFWPKPIMVFCTVTNELTDGKPQTHRVAAVRTIEEARAAIADDRRAMAAPTPVIGREPEAAKGRVYRAFAAVWSEIPL